MKDLIAGMLSVMFCCWMIVRKLSLRVLVRLAGMFSCCCCRMLKKLSQERVSDIQDNIPENFTTTLRDSFFNILQQQQENIPVNLTSTLRDNFLTIIQQQNMTDNIPAIRSFIQDNAANLTLPEGVNLQNLLSVLPAEEASTNLRSSVADNIPDRDTINTGIQTVLDIIPENALDTAGSLLTNLFGR